MGSRKKGKAMHTLLLIRGMPAKEGKRETRDGKGMQENGDYDDNMSGGHRVWKRVSHPSEGTDGHSIRSTSCCTTRYDRLRDQRLFHSLLSVFETAIMEIIGRESVAGTDGWVCVL